LRPAIDARVFAFIAGREFGRSDFPQTGANAHRIDRSAIAALLREAALPWDEIERAARWMAETIEAGAMTTPQARKGSIARLDPQRGLGDFGPSHLERRMNGPSVRREGQ
jgi:hypothetical protein